MQDSNRGPEPVVLGSVTLNGMESHGLQEQVRHAFISFIRLPIILGEELFDRNHDMNFQNGFFTGLDRLFCRRRV